MLIWIQCTLAFSYVIYIVLCKVFILYFYLLPVPTAPRSLTVVNTTDSTVTLSWMPPDPPNGIITQYELQYRRVGGSYTSLQPLNTDLTRTVTGLTSGTQYEFRVRARTTVEYGSFSNIVTAFVSKL